MLFGAYDETKFEGALTWHPVRERLFWTIEAHALLVGDAERRRVVVAAMTPGWRSGVVRARGAGDRERFASLFRVLLPHASREQVHDVWVALRPEH